MPEPTKEELKKELEDYKEVFDKLQPFIVLAVNSAYFDEDSDEVKQELENLGYYIE